MITLDLKVIDDLSDYIKNNPWTNKSRLLESLLIEWLNTQKKT
jgi:hypothetical protein